MELTTLFIIIWLHFIADFVLQSSNMSLNKWNSLKWLGVHSIVYGIPFLYFGLKFALITGGLHFIVDFISSKITHKLWKKEEVHWFFVVIGIDQSIHLTFLIATIKYLGLT